MGEKHTRHDWCACGSFRNLQMVDTSWLGCSLLLPVYLSGDLSLRRLRCGVETSRSLRTVTSKVTWLSTMETGTLASPPLRWCRCLRIPLGLLWPIVLRPLGVLLLNGSNHHLLLIWGPGRCLICQSGVLGSTSRRTSCDLSFPLFQVMKPEVFFHCYSIIY